MKLYIAALFTFAIAHGQVAPNMTRIAPDVLCYSTINACNMACNGTQPLVNVCDPKALNWDCECKQGQSQMILDHLFPIPVEQCQLEYTSCLNACNKDTACAGGCMQKFNCLSETPRPVASKVSVQQKQKTSSGHRVRDWNESSGVAVVAVALGYVLASL